MIKNKSIGVQVPDILLPEKKVDLTKWSVVACDQYTSQPDYWKKVEDIVGNSPSTLTLIYPEVYLENDDNKDRIKNINSSMKAYIDEGILVSEPSSLVLVDRKTSHAPSRKGLILAIDLEMYDYNKGSQTLVRATEGTVIERLPPRIKVRENASIELPHVMLLIDDPHCTVIEPLAEKASSLETLYDFELMMEGGHIKGYRISDPEHISEVLSALQRLSEPEIFRSKYAVDSQKGILLFAVGDGNHSLATAKACWENLKRSLDEDALENHPARYALVEVVNVHDKGLVFEPIHRVVFNVDAAKLLDEMVEYLSHCNASYSMYPSKDAIQEELGSVSKDSKVHAIPFITSNGYGLFKVSNPNCNLEVGTLQSFLDEVIKSDASVKIDYIHGDDVVEDLGAKPGNIGFFLPPMDKNDLFKTVILDGALPRKTFSMGEAYEKRFYLECRKISD